MVYLLGLMEESIKENIKMIKNVVMVFLNGKYFLKLGLMEENIKVAGKTENSMEKVNFITFHLEYGEKASGMMEKELDGSPLKLQNNFFKFLIN